MIGRRTFIAGCGMLAAEWRTRAAGAENQSLKISVPDSILGLESKPEAVALAQSIGFDGVGISLGKSPVNGRLATDDDDVLTQYVDQWRLHQIALTSLSLDILQTHCLMNDERGRRWALDAIRLAERLGVKLVLLPCVLECAPKGAQIDLLGDALRQLAPHAEKAGVTLGIQDSLPAEQKLRLVERTKSDAVKISYHAGNASEQGFDIASEIQRLGKGRICLFQLQDGRNFLGQGRLDFARVIRAVQDIGYEGFLSMETPIPTGALPTGLRRNLAWLRAVLQRASM